MPRANPGQTNQSTGHVNTT